MLDVIFGMDRRFILIHTWAMKGGAYRITKLESKVVQEEAARISELVKLVASIFGVTKHV